MPDVKVRYPHDLFDGIDHDPTKLHGMFKEVAKQSVAQALSCADYQNGDMNLTPEAIDVYTTSYTPDQVSIQGAPVLVEIIGYDYPTRMQTINLRLLAIQNDLSVFVGTRTNYAAFEKLVGVTFIPIPDGCWV